MEIHWTVPKRTYFISTQGREIPNKPLNLVVLRKIKCLTSHTINRIAENKI